MATYMYAEPLENGSGRAPCKFCRLDQNVDFAIPRPLTRDETRKLALRFSHSIFSNWTQLNAILKRFEAAIHKRWTKKTTKQRLDLLVKARPGMSQTHRPDFEPLRNMKRRGQARSSTCNAEAQLWPCINQEDLLKDNLLLLFLHSRGRNMPEVLIKHDIDEAHLGHDWGTDYDDDFIIVFMDQHSPKTYGRLTTRSKMNSGGLQLAAHVRKDGILGLEIQDGIYTFLLACARLILHDVAPSQFFIAESQVMPEVPTSFSDTWESVTKHALEAPYRSPQRMDLRRVNQIVSSRVQVAQDHLWSLREDPGYFLQQLKEWKEHNSSRLGADCDHTWNNNSGELISDALVALMVWTWMENLLLAMPPLSVQLRRVNKKDMRFSPPDELAWTLVLVLINPLIERPLWHFEAAVPSSPRMRGCYRQPHSEINCPHRCGDGCDSLWNLKNSAKASRAELRVDRIFYMITDEENRMLHGLRHLVEEVQYMLDTDSDANALMDSWLMEKFSDLAVLVYLKRSVLSMYPWCGACETRDIMRGAQAGKYTYLLMASQDAFNNASAKACAETNELSEPLDSHFHYPVDKRRTKETTKQMRVAEQNLAKFWLDIEKGMKPHAVNLAVAVSDFTGRDIHNVFRTPKWTAEEELATVMAATRQSPASRSAAFYHTPLTPGSENKKRELPMSDRLKLKTKGITQSALPMTPPSTPLAPTTLSTPTLLLPRRVYRVISALLPTTATATQTPREIAWEELLYAFNAIGLVPEKLYGSVWIFKPVPPGEGLVTVHRSIQFHEPKDVRRGNKVPAWGVKVFGRRLKRAFGWEGGMFGEE